MNSLTSETYCIQSDGILTAAEDYRLTIKLDKIWYLRTIHFVTALSNILSTCSKSASAGVGKNHQEMGKRFLVMAKSHLSFIFLLNEVFIHSLIIHFKIQFFLIQRLSLAKQYQNKIDNWGLYSARQLYNLSIDFFTEGPSSNTFFKIGIHSTQG